VDSNSQVDGIAEEEYTANFRRMSYDILFPASSVLSEYS
jgi:hypothetical protein